MNTSRRQFLAATSLAALAPLSLPRAHAAADRPRFTIGACDWSIGRTAEVSALELGKEIGLDGVQVSLGTAANDMHLRKPEVQQRYRDAAQRLGVGVLSLAIGELNNIPYKSDPRTIPWVRDSIEVCRAMGCRVVLLAFFHLNDLREDAAGTDETVRRLKEVAPLAEKAGVTLGIESWLSAEDHMRIIDRVGSKAVKVYYDVANSTERGYDIFREMRWLGKQGQICEFHMKENGALLGHGKVDFAKVREALEDIGYSGPMQIEGAIPPGGQVTPSYQANQKFLHQLFRAPARA